MMPSTQGVTILGPPRPEFPPTAIAVLAVCFLLLLAVSPLLARFACRLLHLEKKNFRGDILPAATGIGFLIVAVVLYGSLSASDAPLAASSPVFLVTSVGFGLLGLFDDLYGNRAVGGFRGHLKSLATGRPSTGAMKLVGGGFIALAAAFLVNLSTIGHSSATILLNALIIALSANTLNLLDVRPGRAQFGFLALAMPALYSVLHQGWGWVQIQPPPAVLLGPIALAALAEWWPDSRGSAMMGDTGSNLLGAVAGLAAVTVLGLPGKLIFAAVLIGINLVSERASLSAIIAKNRVLRTFDGWLGAR